MNDIVITMEAGNNRLECYLTCCIHHWVLVETNNTFDAVSINERIPYLLSANIVRNS
jgi:hypothetical protein